jgi:hypothetical protein
MNYIAGDMTIIFCVATLFYEDIFVMASCVEFRFCWNAICEVELHLSTCGEHSTKFPWPESTRNSHPCIYPLYLNTEDPNICCCHAPVFWTSKESVFELCPCKGLVHATSELGGTGTFPDFVVVRQWSLIVRG